MIRRIIIFIFFTACAAHAGVGNSLYSYDLSYSNEKMSVDSVSIRQVTDLAMQHNLEYAAIKTDRDKAAKKIDQALMSMFPEIRASAAMNDLDKSRPDYTEKAATEKNLNAKVKFSQTLFSDELNAARDTAEYKTEAQRFVAETTRLDIIMKASAAYFAVLHWKTAEQNAASGLDILKSINPKKLKTAQRAVLASLTSEQQKTQAQAGRNLQYAIAEITYQTGLTPSGKCEFQTYSAMTMSEYMERLGTILTTPMPDETFERVTRLFIDKALNDSPELKALDELIKLNKRDIESEERKYTTPDISLNGEYTQFLDKSPETGDYTADWSNNRWNLNLKLTIPIFDKDNNKLELYQKNTELMQYMHSRVRIRELVKNRMTKALDDAREAGSMMRAALQEKAAAEAAYTLDKNSTDKAMRLIAADSGYEDAQYFFATTLLSLQRAYGKFIFIDGDSSDQRFIDDLSAAAGQ